MAGHYRRQCLEHLLQAKGWKARFVKQRLDGKPTLVEVHWAMHHLIEALDLVRLNRGTGHLYVCLLNEWVKLRNMQI